VVHVEPIGEQSPAGTNTFFRHQSGYLEALFADWRAADRLRLFAGKFAAPFGYGHHVFPGAFLQFRAHEVHLIRESVGAGATATWLSDARWGEHDISAAAFFLDTSFLSRTPFTNRRCCVEGFERFRRNTLHQGGAGNTGRPESFAIALDGDRIGFLPDFTYHAALLSRAPGEDGTAREWGYPVGGRYLARWTPEIRALFVAEHVEFRNAGGAPLGPEPSTLDEASGEEIAGAEVPVRERRRFTTLGAQTTHGPWRATAAWQRDQRKRSLETVPNPALGGADRGARASLGLRRGPRRAARRHRAGGGRLGARLGLRQPPRLPRGVLGRGLNASNR
jgi:hypothetical protein